MFKRFKITLTVVLVLSFLGGVPLPSHQFSPIHQAQAGPLKWTAKKAIGGLIKIAVIKIGTKAGKFALQRLKKIGKDKVKRANIIRHANNYLKKHPKLRNQAIAAFATIGWQLEAGSDLPGLGGITSKAPAITNTFKGISKNSSQIKSMNPNAIRFSHDSISKRFSNGDKVKDLTEGLKSGRIKAEDVPPIRITNRNGKTYTLDNRRLKAFQDAGIKIRTRLVTELEAKKESWRFTSKTDGKDVKVRGNTNE